MTISKNLGVFMDHASAVLISTLENNKQSTAINSLFTHQQKEMSISKSENLMHNKEQHLQSSYYKELGDVIKHYDHVLLFEPTDAKVELQNVLKANPHFSKIKISVKDSDKLSENKQHAFVKDYFANCL